MTVPCICEICNCGRHKCPHKPKQRLPWGPCVMSEYRAQYLTYNCDPVKAIRPECTVHQTDEPLASETTHRVDYKPNCLEAVYRREPEKYHPPTQPMEKSTMYRNEFTPKLCAPPPPAKPFERTSCPAAFEGNPTYRSDYRPWNIPPIKRREPDPYRPPTVPFEALPSYRTEFVPHCQARPKLIKPDNELSFSDKPLEGLTDYRQNYVPHPLEKRPAPPKPIVRAQAPFEGMTTTQVDYTPKEFCTMKNFRPEDCLTPSSDPISQMTTNRVDYTPHELQTPFRYHPDPYKKPEGDMEKRSTYANDFPVQPLCKVEPVQLKEFPKCEAPFNGESNYRSDFRPWNVKPCIVKPVNKFMPPDVPMDGLTTNRAEYVPRALCKVPNFKPPPTIIDNGPFDGVTNYRVEYTDKGRRCHCPAAFLQKDKISPDGYIFKSEDELGHQHYKLEAGKAQA